MLWNEFCIIQEIQKSFFHGRLYGCILVIARHSARWKGGKTFVLVYFVFPGIWIICEVFIFWSKLIIVIIVNPSLRYVFHFWDKYIRILERFSARLGLAKNILHLPFQFYTVSAPSNCTHGVTVISHGQ